jgi:hypothetical protein
MFAPNILNIMIIVEYLTYEMTIVRFYSPISCQFIITDVNSLADKTYINRKTIKIYNSRLE